MTNTPKKHTPAADLFVGLLALALIATLCWKAGCWLADKVKGKG